MPRQWSGAGAGFMPAVRVISPGSEPVIPPIPGLAELDGVWTKREPTGHKRFLRAS